MTAAGGPVYKAIDLTKAQIRKLWKARERGTIHQLHRGIYVDQSLWSSLDKRDQDRLSITTMAEARDLIVVGRAAALIHGLSLPLSTEKIPIELGRESFNKSGTKGVIYRRMGSNLPSHIQSRNGRHANYRISDITRTLIDIARWYPLSEAVAMMDHALAHKLTSANRLAEYLNDLLGYTGIAGARTAVKLATPWSESPRESHVKVALYEAGLPAPYQQVEILDDTSWPIARLDFFYDSICLALEYDGRGKRTGKFEISPLAAISQEMSRHERLSNQGILVFHIDAVNFRNGEAIKNIHKYVNDMLEHPRPFPVHKMRAKGRAW